MFEAIKKYLQDRSLKRYASKTPTSIMPLDEVRTAVAFIDVEDTKFNTCKNALLAFFRDNGIKGEIYFLDFRKITAEERLITSISTTILKKDLNWYGRPSQEKINLLTSSSPDLFITLVGEISFPMEFMARCSNARFKVARAQIPGNVFDLVVSDPSDRTLSQLESFEAMKAILAKIQK